jgi:hypothetical protein
MERAALSTGIAIIILLFGEHTSSFFLRQSISTEIETAHEKLYLMVQSEVDSELFRSPEFAHKYIFEELKNTNRIFNTIFRMGDHSQKLGDYYSKDSTESFSTFIKEFISNGGIWHDVISDNMSDDYRKRMAKLPLGQSNIRR